MTDQTTTTDPASRSAAARRTRRQLLAGGTGALAAVLTAETLARPAPAAADNCNPVVLGQDNTETRGTGITNTTGSSPVLLVTSTGSGDAIIAQSPDGVAVDGSSTTGFGGAFSAGSGIGVTGSSGGSGPGVRGVCIKGEGVYGQNGSKSSALTGVNNGVHGVSDSSLGNGVLGENSGGGAGVAGASGTGVAVLGQSPNGTGVSGTSANGTGVSATGQTALRVAGPAVFDRSGTLTISAGKASATQTGIAPLTAASLVLATVQQNLSGVYVRAAVPNAAGDSFTVYLSKAPSVSAKVA
jgi:hypothetical protein